MPASGWGNGNAPVVPILWTGYYSFAVQHTYECQTASAVRFSWTLQLLPSHGLNQENPSLLGETLLSPPVSMSMPSSQTVVALAMAGDEAVIRYTGSAGISVCNRRLVVTPIRLEAPSLNDNPTIHPSTVLTPSPSAAPASLPTASQPTTRMFSPTFSPTFAQTSVPTMITCPPGSLQTTAGRSCRDIKDKNPCSPDGIYWIMPDGINAEQVVCDMTRDGGGWTMVLKHWYQSGATGKAGALGSVSDALTLRGGYYKLSDPVIQTLIGCCGFSVMGDQNTYAAGHSTSNAEYAILRNYTARWSWTTVMSESFTPTTLHSYRVTDNALAWSGKLSCGNCYGGWGINCNLIIAGSTNPAGGSGCNFQMGTTSNMAWHHFYMANTDTDSYIYLCNGQQASSSDVMNHRWWIREEPQQVLIGLSAANPGRSCKDIKKKNATATDGFYWINPDPSQFSPFQVVCSMNRDGGGWTMAIKTWYQAGVAGNAGAMGTVDDALRYRGTGYKLSDAQIRAIAGPRYAVMADATNYFATYSTGNYEYVLLHNYTSTWSFSTLMPDSVTPTTFQSYRAIDNALAWEGRLQCSDVGNQGINCFKHIGGVNPAGGSGCAINMGTGSNTGWHDFRMSQSSDTYIYFCNGAQYSSSLALNHRFWFREHLDTADFETIDGLVMSRPGRSCLDIKTRFPYAPDGAYWINPDPALFSAFQVQCDMTRDGGGWTFGLKAWYQSGTAGNANALGNIGDALAYRQSLYKLSDAQIRAVSGIRYDVLFDQSGYLTTRSPANNEYVITRNYSGILFAYTTSVGNSMVRPTTQAYRLSDNALLWTGSFQCGNVGGFGINCRDIVAGPNPTGGGGCSVNLGLQTSTDYHLLYMGDTNTDTYQYMCSSQQYSSSAVLNHRYWFREVPVPPMDGLTSASPGRSCLDLKTRYPNAIDGPYWINPDPAQFATPFQAQCDMTRDGGGWTLGLKAWYQSGMAGKDYAIGNIWDATTQQQAGYKLSDVQIRAIAGIKYSVLADQAGYNSAYASGNYEYVILRNYSIAGFSYTTAMPDAPNTKMQSYRLSDGAEAWSGVLQCGVGSFGINCYNVLQGTTPGGGLGCNINMGLSTSVGWHHWSMGESDTNTLLYICAGAQHSSSYPMNHRFWFRETVMPTMDGLRYNKPGRSCLDLKTRFPFATDGFYWINPEPALFATPFQVQCDMTRDGGGWTLGLKAWYQGGIAGVAGAMGNIGDALTNRQTPYKLSDTQIRAIAMNKYSILMDQSGYYATGSSGNREFTIMRNYTAFWQYTTNVAESATPTQLQSYRVGDELNVWTGRLQCGGAGFGINCYTILAGTNPSGGAGCTTNLGIASNTDWHYWYQGHTNTDTYMMLCNGNQATSNGNAFSHRSWFREQNDDTDGLVPARAGRSCWDIKQRFPFAVNGFYWINPNATLFPSPVQVQCDMTRDGGGWTLGIKTWYQAGVAGNANAIGSFADALSLKGNPYKLSDVMIRALTGTGAFSVLADQAGFNSYYSNVNNEYVILRNYTGAFTYTAAVPESTSRTTMQSYRLSDNALAWTGRLGCGEAGFGINCNTVLSGPNPAGGSGCAYSMGIRVDVSYHTFYMGHANTDTYLYICNGAQHSSSYVMNHRYWFRGV